MPRVNPDILRWARETAGLSLDAAATKIELNEARGIAAADRLAAIEAGDVEPSRPLLLRMSKQYRRPLLAFYLSAPPRSSDKGQDFRTLPEDPSPADEAILDALITDLLARQALVRAALEDEDEAQPLAFVGSAQMEEGIQELVNRFREVLLPIEQFRRAPGAEEAFRLLRTSVERLGVFVVLASNLGGHHTTLSLATFRGFAVADSIAPFIVINDQDSRAAWSFTLLHELAHLWLGYTGVSGGSFGREVEQFCNEVASEFLVQERELAALVIRTADIAVLHDRITQFARERNVSRSMVAYRMMRRNLITPSQWTQLADGFHSAWLEHREARREEAREQEGGPSYYVIRRQRLGDALLATTQRLLKAGALTTTKAGRVLGVKPTRVQTLMAGVRAVPRGAH